MTTLKLDPYCYDVESDIEHGITRVIIDNLSVYDVVEITQGLLRSDNNIYLDSAYLQCDGYTTGESNNYIGENYIILNVKEYINR